MIADLYRGYKTEFAVSWKYWLWSLVAIRLDIYESKCKVLTIFETAIHFAMYVMKDVYI